MTLRAQSLKKAIRRLREALQALLTGWLAMLEDRNQTAHTYDEALAKDVYQRLPRHLPLLEKLLAAIQGSERTG